MKNILILCDAFPPAFNPRMGYLCKYLSEYGYKPIIITEQQRGSIYSDLAENQNVTRINFYNSESSFFRKIKYAIVFLAEFIFDYKSLITKREAIKKIKQYKISFIISSSSCKPFSALAASKISRKYKIPFVMDLRDIIEQFPSNEHISKKILPARLNNFISYIITKRFLRQRNKVLKNANVVTTVSEWHKEVLSKYNENVHLIYNGFDHDLFSPQVIENNRFVISYTGRIESQEVKDPALFFEAMANLLAEKKIDVEKLKIQFYLIDEKSKVIVKNLAEKHKIADLIDIFDTIQNSEIPQILNESSVLLLLANKSTGENAPKGIMGTKTFEYLAVEKPVLCVRNDEDCLEKTINEAQAGLSASTTEEVEKFILEKYAEWQQNGFTHQAVNREYIQRFSRKHQAEQFVEILKKLSQTS